MSLFVEIEGRFEGAHRESDYQHGHEWTETEGTFFVRCSEIQDIKDLVGVERMIVEVGRDEYNGLQAEDRLIKSEKYYKRCTSVEISLQYLSTEVQKHSHASIIAPNLTAAQLIEKIEKATLDFEGRKAVAAEKAMDEHLNGPPQGITDRGRWAAGESFKPFDRVHKGKDENKTFLCIQEHESSDVSELNNPAYWCKLA